jgi:hypothetical protein
LANLVGTGKRFKQEDGFACRRKSPLTSHQDSFFPCGYQALTKKNLVASLEKAAKNTKKIGKF